MTVTRTDTGGWMKLTCRKKAVLRGVLYAAVAFAAVRLEIVLMPLVRPLFAWLIDTFGFANLFSGAVASFVLWAAIVYHLTMCAGRDEDRKP